MCVRESNHWRAACSGLACSCCFVPAKGRGDKPCIRLRVDRVDGHPPCPLIACFMPPQDDSELSCPKRIRANIEGGLLHLRGWELPLPFIRGSGQFEVVFLSDQLRLFRSGGSLAVQVKASLLEAHLENHQG